MNTLTNKSETCTLKTIKDAYDTKLNRIKAKKEKVERLERQIYKLQDKVHWTDDLIKPLMDIVIEKFPTIVFDTDRFVPMGLHCKVSVFGRVQNLPEGAETLLSIVFSPHTNGVAIETGEESYKAHHNSLAYMNNLNMKTVDLTSVDQLLNHVQRQFDELTQSATTQKCM